MDKNYSQKVKMPPKGLVTFGENSAARGYRLARQMDKQRINTLSALIKRMQHEVVEIKIVENEAKRELLASVKRHAQADADLKEAAALPMLTLDELEVFRQAQAKFEKLSALLEMQQENHKEVEEKLHVAEYKLGVAEAQLSNMLQNEEDIIDEEEVERDVRQYKADGFLKTIDMNHTKALRQHEDNMDQVMQMVAENEERLRQSIQVAKKGPDAALKRLRKEKRRAAEFNKQREETLQAMKEERKSAKAELEASVKKIRMEDAEKRVQRIRRQKEKEKVWRKETHEILAAGGNPYEVERLRRQQKRTLKDLHETAKRSEARELEIVKSGLKDDEMHRKEQGEIKMKNATLKEYLRSTGPVADRERLETYLKSRTIGGKEIIDPSGSLPELFPSTLTTIKTKKFGTGEASDLIVDKQLSVHMGTTFKEGLVPRLPEDTAGALERTRKESDDESGDAGQEEMAQYDATKAADLKSGVSAPGLQKLTVYERKRLAEAKKRQQESIGSKVQVAGGRVFKGAAFAASPSEVVFKDFEVGKEYSQVITVTNISFSRNTAKVLPLEADIRNFFDVEFSPPGYISAGLTFKFKITFVPKVYEDIDSHIVVLAETGPIKVPLKCFTRKAIVSLKTSEMNFGELMLGNKVYKEISVKNAGIVPVTFGVTVSATNLAKVSQMDDGDAMVEFVNARLQSGDDPDKEDGVEMRVVHCGKLNGYSSAKIGIIYEVNTTKSLELDFRVKWSATAPGFDKTDTLSFTVTGSGTDLPVYVESELLDYKCCHYGEVYTAKQKLFNRGKTALKCRAIIPKPLRHYLKAVPELAFVQAGSHLDMLMKVTPAPPIMLAGRDYVRPDVEESLSIPIVVDVPGMPLPAQFDLHMQFTKSDIVFEPKSLDFGSVLSTESASLEVKITNMCRLPQRFGFPDLHSEVDIQPDYGFGKLLPFEEKTLTVSVSPQLSGSKSCTAKCTTDLCRQYDLPLTFSGIKPLCELAPATISLRPVAINDKDAGKCELRLRNHSKNDVSFEFLVPSGLPVSIMPMVGRLRSKAETRFLVSFVPGEDLGRGSGDDEGKLDFSAGGFDFCSASLPIQDTSGKLQSYEPTTVYEGVTAETLQAESGVPLPRMWSRHLTYKFPCFITPVAPGSSKADGDLEMLIFQLNAAVTYPQMVAEVVDEGAVDFKFNVAAQGGAEEEGEAESVVVADRQASVKLDFGRVAVGNSKTRKVRLFNFGERKVFPRASMLNPEERFQIVNSLRPVAPGNCHVMCLKFSPVDDKVFEEDAIVRCDSKDEPVNTVTVQLVGTGVRPFVSVVVPEDGSKEAPVPVNHGDATKFDVFKQRHTLDMGDVLVGKKTEKQFWLVNSSVFPVTYSISIFSKRHTNLKDAAPAFGVSPDHAEMQSGEAQLVTAVFEPDSASQFYVALLQVQVPNQELDSFVALTGRGWRQGMGLVSDACADFVEDTLESFRDTNGFLPLYALIFKDALYYPEIREYTRFVDVVNAGDKAGSFSLSGLTAADSANGFAVEKSSGPVPAGGRFRLNFSFKPPKRDSGDPNSFSNAGIWVEANVTIKLDGSDPAPTVKESQITLVGFIPSPLVSGEKISKEP